MPNVLIAADGVARAQVIADAFRVSQASLAGDLEMARVRADLLQPSVVLLDADTPWGVIFVDSLPAAAGIAVLVVADGPSLGAVTPLIRAGADAFVRLPIDWRGASVALDTARLARARRTASHHALEALRDGQQMVDDLRIAYREERDRALDLERSVVKIHSDYLRTVRSLATAVDARDPATNSSLERVVSLAESLAKVVDPDLAAEPLLAAGFLLHDLGEVGVPDAVLSKRGRLSADERDLMRTHTVIGAEMVAKIDLLRPVAPIIRHHHERWDGSGYPDGLAGRDIPVAARVFAVADAADAMLHDRPYRSALTIDLTCGELERNAGGQFDPAVVDAFLTLVGSGGSPFPA